MKKILSILLCLGMSLAMVGNPLQVCHDGNTKSTTIVQQVSVDSCQQKETIHHVRDYIKHGCTVKKAAVKKLQKTVVKHVHSSSEIHTKLQDIKLNRQIYQGTQRNIKIIDDPIGPPINGPRGGGREVVLMSRILPANLLICLPVISNQ